MPALLNPRTRLRRLAPALTAAVGLAGVATSDWTEPNDRAGLSVLLLIIAWLAYEPANTTTERRFR